jgi:hypothetical protein
MNIELIEEQMAEHLLVQATDLVCLYLDEQDWDAGVTAMLAKALELSVGRRLKLLEDLWT